MYTYWYTVLGNKTTNMNCVFKINMIFPDQGSE